ncbi:MAG: hypothetical protein HY881_12450 [Deltaproteobacteria bacterium]|nr:hypothetical protein [Deltaproteobacteria bacterium]
MKKYILLSVVTIFGLALFSGCAIMHTWPDDERNAEHKMVVIQEKIGDGLKTGALTLDQSQMFLTKLKGIRKDYTALKDRSVYRNEWESIDERLDALGEEINRALVPTTRIEEPRIGDRIVTVQRRIDDGRANKSLSLTEERDFQSRLNTIRRDYMRMTEGGRYPTREEGADITRKLDLLETDLNRTTRIEEPRIGDRIVALQRRIDDGRGSKRLSLTEERDFQSRLDTIRRDYMRMTEGGRYPTHEEGADITRKLDLLETDLNRTTRIEEPRNGDRMDALQRRIDDGRSSKRLSLAEERDFQSRLDTIRRDYLRMTEGGRYPTHEEGSDISRRLDSLELDLNRLW